MEVNETLFSQPRADIPPSEGEGDRQPVTTAPLEDHSLTNGQHLFGDPRRPACRAVLVWVHAGIIETEAEVDFLSINCLQPLPEGRQVFRGVLHNIQ